MLIRKDSISARWIAALALATGAVGLSGSEICDDFSDRNVYDGDPIRWKMDPGYPAQLTYAACGLQVLDTGDAAGGLFSQEVFSGDVCIRARYSLNGTPAAVMLPLHWNPVTLCEYFVVLLPDGQFSLLRIDMGEWGPTWDGVVPFDPSTANCTIELRTVGPKVEFRAWPASGQRPQDPTMSIIDELYRVGIVGFGVQSDTNMSVCFHEVCIQSGSAAIEPVEDLTCSSPSCDEFALSWVCGQTYDEIVVAADGEVLETIGGDRTSYTGALPAGGVHQFSVKGVSEETESEARSCSVTIEQCPPRFARGDSNSDHKVNIADAVHTLSNLFAHGPAATCLDGADANDDGKVDIADAIAVLSHLFAHTGALPAPFGECGIDPTMDELGCQDYVPCN